MICEADFDRRVMPLLPWVRGRLWRALRGHSSHDLDALAIEVMERAWDSRSSFQERYGVKSWLAMKVKGVIRDELRRLARCPTSLNLPVGEDGDELQDLSPSPSVGPEQQVMGRLELARATAAIKTLPQRDRTALLLAGQGATGPEIAEALGVSLNLSNVVLHRARGKLERCLVETSGRAS